jgi:DNA-binding NtrC family response regulator
MIREPRSREKLEGYYRKFVEEGVLNPNVHPWVAESWARSRELNVSTKEMSTADRLSADELRAYQEKHKNAIEYLERFSNELHEFFQTNNLSLLLIDSDCRVLKSYSLSFYQKTPGEIEGVRVGIENAGTSSISIVHDHKMPFLLFGPEMWAEECQEGDACSAPIIVNGELVYIITLVSVEQKNLPHNAVVSLLLTLRLALERHLTQSSRLKAQEAILDAAPFAVYHVMPDGEVVYANKLGRKRLEGIGARRDNIITNLNEVVMNYRHTPIYRGFGGIPCYNKEVTWITKARTYEDITTVVPLERESDQSVSSVVTVSMPIEDLRTLVAHAAGYTSRYSLGSMVGNGTTFAAVRDKAARVAKNNNFILLQGESGTGKQRMAHGIHQSSPRAAGPLISVKCGDITPDLLEQELFGVTVSPEISHPGKLELANGGTLFIDEIEKIPSSVAPLLVDALRSKTIKRLGEDIERRIDVRIISASDIDLKRLTERGAFNRDLFEIVAKSVVRVPSLRTRREDIPILAKHIIGELSVQHQLPRKNILPETAEKLKNYDWPGNTKQLQGVIEASFFNTKTTDIHPYDVNLMGDVKMDNSWKEDRAVFVKAWQAAGGNVSRLANLLNVSRVTLYRYLKKYGMERK